MKLFLSQHQWNRLFFCHNICNKDVTSPVTKMSHHHWQRWYYFVTTIVTIKMILFCHNFSDRGENVLLQFQWQINNILSQHQWQRLYLFIMASVTKMSHHQWQRSQHHFVTPLMPNMILFCHNFSDRGGNVLWHWHQGSLCNILLGESGHPHCVLKDLLHVVDDEVLAGQSSPAVINIKIYLLV
jgi:hypothetical protein